MRPYERLPEEVEYNGKTYALDLSYAAFFAAADALQDARLSDWIKLETALDILVADRHPVEPGLLEAIYALVRRDGPKSDGPKTMDVVQDWGYIVAAFRQAYGIDLYEDKTLHILHFQDLLAGIPKNTKLAEIVGIRAAEIPQTTKHNAKQVQDLLRLKAMYALRGDTMTMQDAWAKLFNVLKVRAEHGGQGR